MDLTEDLNWPNMPQIGSYLFRPSPVAGGNDGMSTMSFNKFTNVPANSAAIRVQGLQENERLLNAREVAAKLGVSERFIRDHTTRRWPRIPGVKLGKLVRYRICDVDHFMAELHSQATSHRSPYRV
jgi:predicted DNA-binding transcriptional regulator AlpA